MSFMSFWLLTNRILASHGLPEMLYGEARDWWKDYVQSKGAV
jgi:hypothetical protein